VIIVEKKEVLAMKYVLAGVLSIVLILSAIPCLAQEGRLGPKSNPANDIVTRGNLESNPDGGYGPYEISYIRYYIESVVVYFTNGDYLSLDKNGGHDIESLILMALSAWNGSRELLVYIIQGRFAGLQIQ
jgi:hypothetical protein